MKTVLIFIIGVITLVFWAVIGLLFWIPLLIRVIAIFCANIAYNVVVTNPKENSEQMKIPLDYAIIFYAEGFKRIVSTLSINDTTKINYKNRDNNIKWTKFICELLWVVVFWGILLMPFYKEQIYSHYLSSKLPNEIALQLDSTMNYIDYNNIADKYYNNKNYSEAIINYSKSIQMQPDSSYAYYWRANAKFEIKDYTSAIFDLNKAIKINPKKSEYYAQKGNAYFNIENYNNALENYQKAIFYKTDYAIIYLYLADTEVHLKLDDKACLHYKRASELGIKEATEKMKIFCRN